jgi:SAM-dependent methyltransferase
MDDDPAHGPGCRGLSRRTGDQVAISGDYQYRAITRGPRVQRFWHDTKLWLVRHYLGPRPTDRVLDVGCGSGVVAAFLADSPVLECVGVDGNPAAIEFASWRFGRPNLRFLRCLVDEIDLPEQSFDACCCMEVLEHIHPHQGRSLLRTAYRLLKPGGRLLITTPNYRSAWPLIEWGMDRLGLAPRQVGDQHVTFYHHGSLRAQWQDGGWSPVRLHTCCTLAPWIAMANWSMAEAIREVERRLPFGTILVHLLEKPS